MSSSLLDDTCATEGTALVSGILARVSVLPEVEEQFVEAVETICLDLRSLMSIAMFAEKEKVSEWLRKLHHLPEAIGSHPEYSTPAQERIDQLRGIIEKRIDEELPTLGLVPGDDDSGINIGEFFGSD